MTSANFFNGYSVDKTTSRVLAPPGGRSSNIFGTDEPVRAAPQQQQQQQQQYSNGHQNNGHSNGNGYGEQQKQPMPQKETSPQLSAQQEAAINKQHQHGAFSLFDSTPVASKAPEDISITQSHRGQGIKPRDESQANIFGDTSQQVSGARYSANDRQKSSIFADEAPRVQQTNTSNNNKARSGYNTITGNTYESEEVTRQQEAKAHVIQQGVNQQEAADQKARQLHTSSRVLQPPGGRSTGLW